MEMLPAFVELCRRLENSCGVRFVPSKLPIDMAEKGAPSRAGLQVSARQSEACKLDDFASAPSSADADFWRENARITRRDTNCPPLQPPCKVAALSVGTAAWLATKST